MKYTLLIVEDDPDTSEMLRVYFEAQGYQVVLAPTGQDALNKCQSNLPDLILLDVRLPDFDGFEVGKRLQEICVLVVCPLFLLQNVGNVIIELQV
jgi:DNA-binding response OmpR family regulator